MGTLKIIQKLCTLS